MSCVLILKCKKTRCPGHVHDVFLTCPGRVRGRVFFNNFSTRTPRTSPGTRGLQIWASFRSMPVLKSMMSSCWYCPSPSPSPDWGAATPMRVGRRTSSGSPLATAPSASPPSCFWLCCRWDCLPHSPLPPASGMLCSRWRSGPCGAYSC